MSNADKVKQLEAENENLKKQLEDSNFLLGQYMNQKMQLPLVVQSHLLHYIFHPTHYNIHMVQIMKD